MNLTARIAIALVLALVSAGSSALAGVSEHSYEMLERQIALSFKQRAPDPMLLELTERSLQAMRERAGLEPARFDERWWWPRPESVVLTEEAEPETLLRFARQPRGMEAAGYAVRHAARYIAMDRVQEQLLFGTRTCECYCNAACDDGQFCNGAEVCSSFSCSSGPAPDCSVSDPCTVGSCSNSLGECESTPIDPPVEVALLNLSKPDPTADNALLFWNTQPATETFNVYWALDSDLNDLSCLATVNGTALDDGGNVAAAGEVLHFLISAEGCVESGLGDDSSGMPRPNSTPCP